ncbi:hypothetical protein SLEP1_g54687 [Rubroshorea leprosula]|uniref:NB-ARC domain-containing protein n=1 Tax=Rubroshorea leprosula TaxID=152421 RepID=A0AAV5MD80_9ROSI|nr:hypothetical protein SLEP1_g54687 [Rubroshorea leprosula]
MEWVGPSIEIVKLVGGRFVRCLKYQIKYNDLLQKFEQNKQDLRSRKDDIESERETQLQSAPYNIVRLEVEKWLKEVEEFVGRPDVVDEVNSWGYLSCCCQAVILEARTQELKEIYDRGDNYTRDRLVIEDPSKKFNYYVQKLNEWKEKLQCKQKLNEWKEKLQCKQVDIDSILNSQLVYGKIEMEQVKRWRGKVEEMLKGVKDIEDKIGGSSSHSSDSLVMHLGEKIREMETMCEEGSKLPDCLVIDDPSAWVAELTTSELQGSEAIKANILACLKGEEVTMLGVWGMGGVGKTTIMKHVHNELLKEGKFKKIIWGDDVGRLNKLEVFYGRFPTVNDVRIFLKSQPSKLNSYFIIVGSNLDYFNKAKIYESPEGLSRYEKLMLFRETSIVGENTLCPSVQFLFICYCHNIRSLNDFSEIKDVTDLSRCVIWGCDGMEWILSSWINSGVVQTLKYLELWGLDKLDGLFEADVIAKSSRPRGIFSSLKKVVIRECKKIKKLFPSWKLVECLKKLEDLYVDDCEEMEEIIASDPEEEGEEGGDIIKKLILPKLKKLTLSDLPALKSICSRRAVIVCDSLESFIIFRCPHLSLDVWDNLDWVFEVELIATSPPRSSTFSSLKEIEIWHCNRGKTLFPSWKFLEYLQSLERISVGYCEEMEEIIASDPEEEGGDIIKKLILPKLKELDLQFLPALKSICSRRAIMVCDSLESISICTCKALRRIRFCLPPRQSLYGLDDLEDWVFEVELIAMSPPQSSTFSSLKKVDIGSSCNQVKKLFPSWKFVEYLQSLESISVYDCEEMEEIIASDPEEEGEEGEEGGDIIKKLILPKLKRLSLQKLPALKSICSRRAVMVCDSLVEIGICDCKGLRRIPLSLPVVDNAQPSPPSLKKIHMYQREEEWWELLEWDHPNVKDVLRPMVQFFPDDLRLP